METEMNTTPEKVPGEPEFLLCDITGRCEPLNSRHGEVISNPMDFVKRAFEANPKWILLRFEAPPSESQQALCLLCATLKRAPRTRNTPILALLPAVHRRILDSLHQAKVEYVRFVGDTTLTTESILQMVHSLGISDSVERFIDSTCPFLHYQILKSGKEMTVCGAHRDRVILGQGTLEELCHTERHSNCEYFLDPKVKT